MLLAIEIGNTQSVYGVFDGSSWIGVWRRETRATETEDEIAAWLLDMLGHSGIQTPISAAVTGTVVPGLEQAIVHLCEKWLRVPLVRLETGEQVGLPVDYQPKHAVGADRIANALGALAHYSPPLIVVDFGTATTFDVIDASGTYIGGAILTGISVSTDALISKTAKLPPFRLEAPQRAIGKSTVESLQSGIVLGYAGAIDSLSARISAELGQQPKILATGGLGALFCGLCESIEEYLPTLTLDGLRIAYDRITGAKRPDAPVR